MAERSEQEELAMAVLYLAKAVERLAEKGQDVKALHYATKAKLAAQKAIPSPSLPEDDGPPRSTID